MTRYVGAKYIGEIGPDGKSRFLHTYTKQLDQSELDRQHYYICASSHLCILIHFHDFRWRRNIIQDHSARLRPQLDERNIISGRETRNRR